MLALGLSPLNVNLLIFSQ